MKYFSELLQAFKKNKSRLMHDNMTDMIYLFYKVNQNFSQKLNITLQFAKLKEKVITVSMQTIIIIL